MKTIFRFLNTGVLMAAFVAVAVTAGFGQDAAATPNASCADIDGHNALYTKFTAVYQKKTLPEMESALSIGKEYLEKYGTCTEAFKDQIEFVKPHVARIEKEIPAERERVKLAPSFAQFDKGLAAGNPDDVLAAGKQILAVRKDDMNIAFAMALIAAEKSTTANQFKYADDAITYSRLVSSKLKSGWQFDRKYADGPKKGSPYIGIGNYNRAERDAAIAELNYTVAFQTFYGKKDMKSAVPLYYELSQAAPSKDDPRVYGAIGDYYIAEGAPIGDEIAKLILQIKDATDEKVKEDLDGQVKAKIAMFNGYTERALDAYSRAHAAAKSDTPATKAYKDNLYKIMQGLYKRRFEDKGAGLDAYVSTTLAKPFPNPTTPVTPISDPEPPTTTGAATAAPASSAPSTTTAAKPATKPMSTTVTSKPTVAKKGTRK